MAVFKPVNLALNQLNATKYVQTRFINMNNLSNKRITRLESDIELNDSQHKSRLINRNSRNLEQLGFETKPTGFWLEKSAPLTWNKIVFEQSGRYLNTYLLHWSGKKILETSTSEPKLSKYFRNPNTSQAAVILAQVMSRRCLQSGYLQVGADYIKSDDNLGLKNRVFFESLESNGIVLEELPEIVPRSKTDL